MVPRINDPFVFPTLGGSENKKYDVKPYLVEEVESDSSYEKSSFGDYNLGDKYSTTYSTPRMVPRINDPFVFPTLGGSESKKYDVKP